MNVALAVQAIDMWAIGCIFGELLTNHPMFQGKVILQPAFE